VRTRLASGILAAACAAGAPALAAQDAARPIEVRRLAELRDPRLRETSGVAVSRAHPGVIWTLNDSGDGPYLYATDSTGAVRARFEVRGARNVDWEALTLGPCPAGPWRGQACLYVADTGDNDEARPRVVLYAVPEPNPARADTDEATSTAVARALPLRFSDRARDAEALAALPDGTLILITKGRTGAVLRYAIPGAAWEAREFDLANPDTVPVEPQFVTGWVTDAAIDPAGTRAVVRTYTELYFYEIGERWTASGPPCRIGRIEPQGEGVAFLDSGDVLLTSEGLRGRPGVFTVVRCP